MDAADGFCGESFLHAVFSNLRLQSLSPKRLTREHGPQLLVQQVETVAPSVLPQNNGADEGKGFEEGLVECAVGPGKRKVGVLQVRRDCGALSRQTNTHTMDRCQHRLACLRHSMR